MGNTTTSVGTRRSLAPGREECLSWALGNGEVDGVWGGTSEDERRDLVRFPTAERE